MKLGRYIGSAMTRYVVPAIAGIAFSLNVAGQRYDSDIRHYSLPDMNGDSVPEVLTTVSHRPGGGSVLCLLKSGKGADFSYMPLEGNILWTKVREDGDGNFILDIKTDEMNGTHYLGDNLGVRKATRRQIRHALKGD
jgi:hypothetical protein